MKILKLSLAGLLTIALLFNIASCKQLEEPESPPNTEKPASETDNKDDKDKETDDKKDETDKKDDKDKETDDKKDETDKTDEENKETTDDTSKGDTIKFDLTGATSFFAGKADIQAARIARTVTENDKNLMKIDSDGNVQPAMIFNDDLEFDLGKIIRNPMTSDIYLLGKFESKKEDDTWAYSLIRVVQDSTWHGVKDVSDVKTTSEPFDKDGNFYFESAKDKNIYKYSGDTVTQIARNAILDKVLSNGAIVYTVENVGTYIRLADGAIQRLSSGSSQGVYVSGKNIYYYDFETKKKSGWETAFVDDDGNYYSLGHDCNAEYILGADGRKIPFQDSYIWFYADENGKRYFPSDLSFDYSEYEDKNGKRYFQNPSSLITDLDGNTYKIESEFSYQLQDYITYLIGEDDSRIPVTSLNRQHWQDEDGNIYVLRSNKESGYSKHINSFDPTTKKATILPCYCGLNPNADTAEKFEIPATFYEFIDAEGNSYSDYDGEALFYRDPETLLLTVELHSVSTDVYDVTAKYFDFSDNTFKKAATKQLTNGEFYSSNNLEATSANVGDSYFIGNSLYKFEIQSDLSLKCTYNVKDKGVSVATNWITDDYIINASTTYMEKVIENGKKIYFVGKRTASIAEDEYGIYKITDFGTPEAILKGADDGNFIFTSGVSFATNGKFIACVAQKSTGSYGTLQGDMETGTYEFIADDVFESVTDIVINL